MKTPYTSATNPNTWPMTIVWQLRKEGAKQCAKQPQTVGNV